MGFILISQTLSAAQPTLTLAVDSTHAKAGDEATVSLVVLNTGGDELKYATPGEIAATLSIGGKAWPIKLVSHGTVADTLAPNAFAK